MLVQCNIGQDGIIPKATINEIAEITGTTDRRVYTVLEALEAEGWSPLKRYESNTDDQL
jgi:NADH:ubiquinone oxidoreductase subunit E